MTFRQFNHITGSTLKQYLQWFLYKWSREQYRALHSYGKEYVRLS